MAGDASIVFETKVDNKGFQIGLRDAARKVETLNKAHEVATKSVHEQEKAVADLKKQHEAAVKKGREHDAAVKEIASEYKMLQEIVKEAEKMGVDQSELTGYENTLEVQKRLYQSHKEALALLEKTKAEANGIAEEYGKAYKNLSEMQESADNLKRSIEETRKSSVFSFAGQAETAQQDITAMESKIQDLYAQLDQKQESSTVIALQHEITAAEKALESFKNNISEPVADVMAAKQLEEQIRAVNREIQRLRAEYDISTNPIEKMGLLNSIRKAENELGALQAKLKNLENTGLDKPAADMASLGDNAERSGKAIKRAMDTRTPMKFGSAVKGLLKHILGLASGMKLFKRNTDSSSNAVTRLAKRLMNLALAAFVFNVIHKGLSELRSYLDGLLKTNSEFAQSMTNIKVNLMTAFQPIYEAALPAINALVSALAKATAYAAAFISLLFGKTYAESRAAAKSLNSQAEALKGVGSAAKEARKQLAGFDEINQLSAETADSGGGSVSNLFDEAEVPELDMSWLDEFKQKLLDIVPDLDYFYNLGADLADRIIEGLNNIPWDDIQDWAKSIAQKLAAFLNGSLANPELWEAMGHTVAEALNTALIFAYNFLTTFNFGKFGRAIAAGINKFFTDANWALFGQTISKWVLGLLEFILAVIKGVDWVKIGESLRTLLTNIEWGNIAKAVFDVIKAAFGAVYDFLVGLLGKPLADTLISTAAAIGTFIGVIGGLLGTVQLITSVKGAIDGLSAAFSIIGTTILRVFGGAALIALSVGVATFASLADLSDGWVIALDILAGALAAIGTAMIIGFGGVGWAVGAIAGIITVAASLSEHFGVLEITIKSTGQATKDLADAEKELTDALEDYKSAQEKAERATDNVRTAQERLKEAEDRVIETKERLKRATEDLTSLNKDYINSVKDSEKAALALEEAEKKLGISGKELSERVAQGTLDYKNMTAAQREVYEAYMDNEIAQDRLNNTMTDFEQIQHNAEQAAINLEKAERDVEKAQKDVRKSLEDEAKAQKDLIEIEGELKEATKKRTDALWDNELAMAAQDESFRTNGKAAQDYKDKVVDAFEKGKLSADEARDLIEKALSGISNKSKETFTEDLPADIEDGLNPKRYETAGNALKRFFQGLFATPTGRSPASGGRISASSSMSGFSANISPLSDLPIPRLARGGIVDSATIAMIGERGREAVVPLSQNSEWMKPMQDVRDQQEITNSLLRQLIESTAQRGDMYLDSKLVTDSVMERIRAEAMRTGRGLGLV